MRNYSILLNSKGEPYWIANKEVLRKSLIIKQSYITRSREKGNLQEFEWKTHYNPVKCYCKVDGDVIDYTPVLLKLLNKEFGGE